MDPQRSVFIGCCILFTILIQGTATAKVSYKGYQVIRIFPENQHQLHVLNRIIDSNVELDVWRRPSRVNTSVDLNVSPMLFPRISSILSRTGITFHTYIPDVQALIDQQNLASARRGKLAAFDYFVYHKLDEIQDWVREMAATYPNMAETFEVGKSFESRTLLGLKISTGTGKPGFWMEGGIHAREWISPATVIYIAGKMLAEYGNDKDMAKVVDMFDWYILPVTNPDGYEYSRTNDRLWRKTRSIHDGSTCVGVDPNRNWDSHWCEEGSSTQPCSETYCGPSVNSESEVKGVVDFVNKNGPMKVFIDVHSYSQLWMTPWGHTRVEPPDFNAQDAASAVAVGALEAVHGTIYEHGTIANVIYVASGSSADWAYDKAGIKYSFAVELRDKGQYGFLLPENQIEPSGQETLAAILALAEHVNSN